MTEFKSAVVVSPGPTVTSVRPLRGGNFTSTVYVPGATRALYVASLAVNTVIAGPVSTGTNRIAVLR